MKTNITHLNFNLSVKEILQRMENLFKYEFISYRVDSTSIISNYIPIPLIGIDRRLYSKKNWIGINPFIFISKIELLVKPLDFQEGVQMKININKRRGIILYFIIIALIGFVSCNLPALWAAIILFSFVAVSSYLFIFYICIKKLIISEIANELKI
jgi:hypothetical protein